ncbi:MAG: prephenate dehydrogenase/arogenate dehydrogenase family protein [Kiritimatiellae bacterium]|nr:prephenate dehydrogenase/arogenate dehydrogenase family protein [Kiritimatiellia bacterium]
MKVAILGRGLIGGSIEKAALRAGHDTTLFRGRGPIPDLSGFDIVFLAVPPSAIAAMVAEMDAKSNLSEGAIVLDIAGVKQSVCRSIAPYAGTRSWHFVPAHPMAGKEKTGYANSCENLFDGASMILVPFPGTPAPVLERLGAFLRTLGFGRIVETTPAHHDEMIAFTSQLCHLISSAYVREKMSAVHAGYSAGSFRDMIRVGAPEPDTWTELFLANRDAILPVLKRYIGRLEDFREAIEECDHARLHAALEDGVAAKAKIDEERITL